MEGGIGRTEAFSDGVFAIASTLLVLEIKVPSVGMQAPLSELWHGLADLWPSYLAFVISFGTILIVWVNHYNTIRMLTKTSNAFLYANGFLLLTVTFMPFPTALLARYVETELASVVVVFYACSGLVTNIAFIVWFSAMQKPVNLLKPEIGKEQVNKIWRQMGAGIPVYLFAAIIGWWLPQIGLGLLIALMILWMVMSIDKRISS
jgi:TMEM175 potassium channel family protein